MPPQIQPDLCKDFPASHIHQPAQPHTAPLDPLHLQILQMLINHHPISSFITSHHLMYSVVTDTINAALFDEIGDNVMVCDNDQISIVEDYRDEIADMLDRYGQSHEGAGHDE